MRTILKSRSATHFTDEEAIGTFQLQDPKPALVEVYVGIIQDDEGAEKYRIAALVDVTERERAQREEFARQIRDKGPLAERAPASGQK
jgi:signal transduction histidine kinase